MANHNEYSFPKEYRHYLADLFCKSGIADYTEQIRKLAEVCQCSDCHARRIMAGKREFSGTKTDNGLNKYIAVAHCLSISADELIALDSEYRNKRGPRG